jgi:hypothetical protein
MSKTSPRLPAGDHNVAAMVLVLLVTTIPGNAAWAEEPAFEPLRVPRSSGHRWQQGSSTGSPESVPRGPGSGAWWLGSAGITLILAVCGAICVAARRHWTQEPLDSLRVVGRVSLSSRHSVFLVRAGERVLLIGTGSQGAPSLLGELTETARATPGLDIRLGEAE